MDTYTYSHSDADLVRQPIGYWAWAAHKAAVTHIRAALAGFGLTQPRWWVLNQVCDATEGRTRQELYDTLHGYLDVGEALYEEIDALEAAGLIAPDGGRYRVTPEGVALRDAATGPVRRALEEIHRNVSDEEYVATLKVLQRMIRNVNGDAWHH
ncbi:MarR family winged helix-turn-helix transcriptional regulator [Streptomyces specialis]|uniref:MarR family winged helix-turn-helix transcriptional regulator n=1 Tax=Streptomyces specialis TaxID=498367 RepID=UPI00073EB30C|nr:MarR family winged helix-turn-helix transcriptional regulator [Streptomyces specialis]